MERSTGLVNRQPILAGFYSGFRCGETGAERAGFKNILSCDKEPVCAEVFHRNGGKGLYLIADATQLNGDDVIAYIHENGYGDDLKNGIDCVISTSSCKDVSRSNVYGKPLSRDAYCFVDQLRLINDIKPPTFVIENVDSIEDNRNTWLLREFEMALRGMKDYTATTAILDSSEYGARQIRKRLIVIGVRNDLKVEPSYPEAKLPDYSKVSFQSLFPYLEGFASGQSEKRYKSNYDQIFTTLTAGDQTIVFENGREREFNWKELLVLVEREECDLSWLSREWQKRLCGNGVPSSMAETIFRHVKEDILYKSPVWK